MNSHLTPLDESHRGSYTIPSPAFVMTYQDLLEALQEMTEEQLRLPCTLFNTNEKRATAVDLYFEYHDDLLELGHPYFIA